MPKLVWALLCQRLILDVQTNLVSYIDALDAVTIEKFPVKAPLIVIGTLWQREAEKKMEMRVQVYSPGGQQVAAVEAAPLELKPEHKRARMNVGVAGFEIAGPGRFHFGVETRDKGKWVEVHRVPFDVDPVSSSKGTES
jgi:hypothetical protein